MKDIDWNEPGVIPGLLYFQNGSTYTGSINDFGSKDTKEFRYITKPKDSIIIAEVWYGPYCYEKSEIVDHAEFSLDDDGRTKMIEWMNEKYKSMIES